MRVLTWNLWWRFGPWEERQGAIDAVLGQQEADIVLLQEVRTSDGQVEHLSAMLGLPHTAVTSGPSMGNAILSRWPVAERREVLLPSAADRPALRRAVSASIRTPWGDWPLICTHLDHRFDESDVRLAQVDALADLAFELRSAHDLPVILGGDFNAVPDSDEIRRLTGRTAVRHANLVFADMWELRGTGSGHTWSELNPYLADANWPNRRIDYLFVAWPRPKPAGHPRRVWLAGTGPVEDVQPSDHFAVVADVDVPSVDAPE